ncbi:MAG: hypothetical protein HYV90_00075 [Candidatus Woesebacteria bacterium]|nr:MAG: hypothetical protein HYV90_00075 [Candidatus Woesebacteria bacterium]
MKFNTVFLEAKVEPENSMGIWGQEKNWNWIVKKSIIPIVCTFSNNSYILGGRYE